MYSVLVVDYIKFFAVRKSSSDFSWNVKETSSN